MKTLTLLAGAAMLGSVTLAAVGTPVTNNPAFASYAAPQGNNNGYATASYADPQGNGNYTVASYAQPQGNNNSFATASYSAPETHQGVSTQNTAVV